MSDFPRFLPSIPLSKYADHDEKLRCNGKDQKNRSGQPWDVFSTWGGVNLVVSITIYLGVLTWVLIGVNCTNTVRMVTVCVFEQLSLISFSQNGIRIQIDWGTLVCPLTDFRYATKLHPSLTLYYLLIALMSLFKIPVLHHCWFVPILSKKWEYVSVIATSFLLLTADAHATHTHQRSADDENIARSQHSV